MSDLLRLGPTYQIYDPGTIKPAANGTFTRDPFPGNIIPPGRLNPVGQALLNLYPLPNQAGNADGTSNFFLSGKAIEDYWTTIGRVDHSINDKNRLFVRVHRDFWQEDKNRSFGNDVNGIILNRINRAIAFDDVHVFNPTFLLNFRYGVTQQEFPERRVSTGFDLTSLGFSPTLTSLIPAGQSAIPNVRIGSLTQLSQSESGDGVASSLVHTFVGNFTWIRGNHTLRFGPEFRLYRVFSDRHSSDNAPILDFSNLWGKGPNNTSSAPPVGGELVSVLLGIPGGSMTRSGSFAIQDKYFAHVRPGRLEGLAQIDGQRGHSRRVRVSGNGALQPVRDAVPGFTAQSDRGGGHGEVCGGRTGSGGSGVRVPGQRRVGFRRSERQSPQVLGRHGSHLAAAASGWLTN